MECQVEYTDEFEQWWDTLNTAEQIDVAAHVELLEKKGPHLPFPYSSGINQSRHSRMRELRVQHRGQPYRVLYAFDPRRVAILLLGGIKPAKKLGIASGSPLQMPFLTNIYWRSKMNTTQTKKDTVNGQAI